MTIGRPEAELHQMICCRPHPGNPDLFSLPTASTSEHDGPARPCRCALAREEERERRSPLLTFRPSGPHRGPVARPCP